MKLSSSINIYNKTSLSTAFCPVQQISVSVFTGQTEKITKLETIKSDKLGVLKSIILHKKSPIERRPIKSQKPVLDDDTFLIKMQGYKNKTNFARKMNNLTYQISDMIKNNENFDDILKTAENGVRNIRHRKNWGKKRKDFGHFNLTFYNRGCEYWEKYASLAKLNSENPKYSIKPKSNKEYPNANTCTIAYYEYIDDKIIICYGSGGETSKSNLDLVKQEYEKLKSTKNPSLQEINRSTATIQWLIAQETPYKRGSDSIANLLTKSIYHAYGIKVSPAKEGKSFDFEAFYRDLDDYIKIYPDIFEIPPHKMKD